MYFVSLTTLTFCSLDDNPHILCTTGSCMHKGEGEKKSIIVPVVASIVSLAVIIGALILFLVFRKKKASKVEGINK
jgi:hypothetical protein